MYNIYTKVEGTIIKVLCIVFIALFVLTFLLIGVAQALMIGDANLDGQANMGDVIFIEQYILGLVPQTWEVACDVNQNGVVDMGDVIRCERIILGLR